MPTATTATTSASPEELSRLSNTSAVPDELSTAALRQCSLDELLDSPSSTPETPRPPPSTPSKAQQTLEAVGALSLVVAVVVMQVLVMYDLCTRGLGSSNGRFVSILDSMNTAYGYREQRPYCPDDGGERRPLKRRASLYHAASQMKKGTATGWWRALLILLNNSIVKFGPATLASLLLGEMPVVLKGPKHSISFVLAVLAIQFSPGDVAYRCFRTKPVQAVLAQGVSLYKMRKARFVAQAVVRLLLAGQLRTGWGALFYATVLMYLVVDGSGQTRKLTNMVTIGADGSSYKPSRPSGVAERLWAFGRHAERSLRPHAALVLVLALPARRLAELLPSFDRSAADAADLAICMVVFGYLVWRYGAATKAQALPSECARRLSDTVAPELKRRFSSGGAKQQREAIDRAAAALDSKKER
tara:strand:- start:2015 stop:3262 length:1248 start_codon:yes stop_codon:yes gene_type:complete